MGFTPSTSVSLVSVIPPVLPTHLHVSLTSGTNGRSLGTFQQAVVFREPGAFDRKTAVTFFVFEGLVRTFLLC